MLLLHVHISILSPNLILSCEVSCYLHSLLTLMFFLKNKETKMQYKNWLWAGLENSNATVFLTISLTESTHHECFTASTKEKAGLHCRWQENSYSKKQPSDQQTTVQTYSVALSWWNQYINTNFSVRSTLYTFHDYLSHTLDFNEAFIF